MTSTAQTDRSRPALVQQLTSYATASVIPALLALAGTAIVTRYISSTEYGRYTLVSAAAVLVAALAGQWIQQGVTRYLPGTDGEPGDTLVRAATLSLSVATAALLIIGFGGSLGIAVLLPGWLSLLIPGVIFAGATCLMNGLSAILQARMMAGAFARYRLLSAGVRFVAVVLLVICWQKAPALLWAQVLAVVLVIPGLVREVGWPVIRELAASRPAVGSTVASLARYGIPMTGYFLSATLLDVGDRYVIQWFRGASDVGIYDASYSLIYGAVGLAAAPAILAAHPWLMRAWSEGERDRAARWLGTIIEWFVIIGVGLTSAVWLVSGIVARLLLGPEYQPGHRIMAPVLLGLVAWQAGMYAHKPLEFAGRTMTLFVASLSMAVLNLGLNLALVPRFGFPAAAYTTLAAYLLYTLVTGWLGRKHLQWDISLGTVALWTVLPIALACGAGVVSDGLQASHGVIAATTTRLAGAGLILLLIAYRLVSRWPGRAAPQVAPVSGP